MVIALLDFLINKTRNASFSDNLSIIDLTAWIGAVIDAHPTTINSDGNEDYLNEALQVVNEKVTFSKCFSRLLIGRIPSKF